MSQSMLTDYFGVRKRVPDQHAAKRRKILQETNQALPEQKEKVETVLSVVTSAVDQHINNPKTPSTTEKDSTNSRQSKRSSKEVTSTPTDASAKPKFTQGSGRPAASAKKKLDMSKGAATRNRNVEFTKLSSLSPKKRSAESDESAPAFKVPTPVKELINVGARRPRENISKKLFEDDSAEQSKPRSRARGSYMAEVEKASAVVKKLSKEEIKDRLANAGSLMEFKRRVRELHKDTKKLEEIKKKQQEKIIPKTPTKQISLEVEVPVSPSKAQIPSAGVKASPKKVPAYQRFDYLTKPVEKTLPLPFSYRNLTEVFRCTDHVVSLLFNRGERIVYDKLAKAVQDMMRKNFGEKYLKQIKCVFPQAYYYAWKKTFGKYGQKKDDHELTIEPNLNYKNSILKEDVAPVSKPGEKMGPGMMTERRNIFHNSLLQIVKDQHREFLASLNLSVDDARLTRWHKDFDLSSCREIDTQDLPEKPGSADQKLTTAQEVLEKASDIFNLNPKLGESLVEAAKKLQKSKEEEEAAKKAASASTDSSTSSSPAPAKAPVVPKALKGINPKLLEKIRAKEAQKAMLEMTRDHGEIKKIKQFRRLPNIARMTRSVFVSEKKSSLMMEFVLQKLVQSYPGNVEKSILEEDIRVLNTETKGWLRIQRVRTADYVIINNSAGDINAICTDLEDKLKKLEK